MKPTLGFIGLGLMGAPMSMRLLKAGYTLHIFNRTKEKAASLITNGAHWQNSPADVAANAEIVFTMLTNDAAVKEVTSQIQPKLATNGIHIDCSTVSPELTRALEQQYMKEGKSFLTSPVLGGVQQAIEGSLLLFVGGNDEAFKRVELILNILGEKIWKFPNAETASHLKLIMNSFIAGMTSTLAQAITYSEHAGIGGKTVLDVLNHSKLNSASFQAKGKMMLEKNFSALFFTENLLKDTNLFIDAAHSLNSPTPIAETAKTLLEKALAQGLGKDDYSAIIKVLNKNW